MRIHFAERAFAADVGVEPLVADGGEVGAFAVAVVGVAADAGPGGVGVFAAVGSGRLDDVEKCGKFAADPGAGVVLIGNGVDAELGDEFVYVGGRLCGAGVEQAPARACWRRPKCRSRAGGRRLGGGAKDGFGAGRHFVWAGGGEAVGGLAGEDAGG